MKSRKLCDRYGNGNTTFLTRSHPILSHFTSFFTILYVTNDNRCQ